jgi:hypothetical protein
MSPRLTASKVLLVADPRAVSAGGTSLPIRRFRLARLQLAPRPVSGPARFDHIKRAYD